MESISLVTLPAAAPRHVPDMRPSADAAATRRIDQPVGLTATPAAPAIPVVAPPDIPPLPGAPREVERVLKPYGVQMLPASVRDDPQEARRDPAAGPERERPTAEAPRQPAARPRSEEPTGLDPRSRAEGQMARPEATPPALPRVDEDKATAEKAPRDDSDPPGDEP